MSNPSISAVETAVPEKTFDQEEALDGLDKWLAERDTEQLPFSVERSRSIFKNAGVDKRHSVSTMNQMLGDTNFGQKSQRFLQESQPLAVEVIGDAISSADISIKEIDLFVTVSCTGFVIPSLDAYLMNELNFGSDTTRLPIAELGCAGGAASLARARDYLIAYPDSNVLILSVELCTLNFQPSDLTRAQIVSGALFGDGAAAVVLTGDDENTTNSPEYIDYETKFFEDSLNYMGYKNNKNGMSIMLSPKIPAEVKRSSQELIRDFLSKKNCKPDDIDHFVVHPGGRAILDALEESLNLDRSDLNPSRSVLKKFGNLSSATVLFVLKEVLSRNPSPGDTGLVLAFGPGFNANLGLLEWSANP